MTQKYKAISLFAGIGGICSLILFLSYNICIILDFINYKFNYENLFFYKLDNINSTIMEYILIFYIIIFILKNIKFKKYKSVNRKVEIYSSYLLLCAFWGIVLKVIFTLLPLFLKRVREIYIDLFFILYILICFILLVFMIFRNKIKKIRNL